MHVSQKGLDLIKKFEGCSLTAYPDPGSANGEPWTIGVGHTKGVKKGDKITAEQADDLLRQDLSKTEEQLNKSLVGIAVNQNEYDALVSLAFNIGITAFNRSTVKRMLAKGDRAAAANAFGMWVKNDGKILKGLVRRRAAEKALFLEPTKHEVERMSYTEIVKPESSTTPQVNDKPLSKSKEIGAGIALGGTAIVNTINNLTVDDLSTAQSGIKNLRTEVGTAPEHHSFFSEYIVQGASILIFLIGAFIIWKRIKDRKEGKR